MREFLTSLVSGLSLQQVPPAREALLTELLSRKIVKKEGKIYRLGSDFRVGKLDLARDGTGFVALFGSELGDLLIESDHLSGATKNDFVIAKRLYKKRGRPSGTIVFIAQKNTPFSLGYIGKKGKNTRVVLDLKYGTELMVQASQKSLQQLPFGTVFHIDNQKGEIKEVLGVLDDPAVDEKISLALYNKKEEFSKKAESEARAYGDSVDSALYPDRVDLTHLPFCTIDPLRAKDHDDAVYYDENEHAIYVAIADVSEYVAPLSHLDQEAFRRGFSIYFPHKSIPMLPRALSENICSLKENVERLAFVFKLTLYKSKPEVKKEELLEAVIRSRRKYTYERIDEFLTDGKNTPGFDSVDEGLYDALMALYKVTKTIRKKRLQSGYDFANDEIQMILDQKLRLQKTAVEKETPSHSLIEECMLLANKAAAKRLKQGIWRIHEEPGEQKIVDLLNDLATIGIYPEKSKTLHELIHSLQEEARKKDLEKSVDTMIIRAMQQASYSPDNSGHFGLGFDNYTHFTSPIRRYSDLVVHRLLKAQVRDDKKQERYLVKNLDEVATKISTLERESAKVAWDLEDRKYARWAFAHLGETFDARVIDVDKNTVAVIEDKIQGARVYLSDMGLALFDQVRIQLLDADLATARITGRITEIKRSIDV